MKQILLTIIEFLQSNLWQIVISFIVTYLIWAIFTFRNEIIDKYKQYEQKHSVTVVFWEMMGTAVIIFMIISNRCNILSFLKSKTAPTWFGAIGTISTVIIALSPKLRKKPDLNLNALIENEKFNNFKIKFEISNGASNNVKVFPSAHLKYFGKNAKGEWVSFYSDYNISFIEPLSTNFIIVPGLATIHYETKKIKINIEEAFPNQKPSIAVCSSSILVDRGIEWYHDVRIYKIINNDFIQELKFNGNNLSKIEAEIEDLYKIKI